MSRRRWISVILPGVLVAWSAALVAMHLAHGGHAFPSGWYVVFTCGLSFAMVGGLVVWRRPRHRLGWLLVALGCVASLQTAVELFAAYSLHVDRLPLTPWLYLLSVFAAGGLITLLTLIFLLFPDGAAPPGAWQWLVWATVVVGLGRMTSEVLAPGHFSDSTISNPIGIAAPWLHTADNALNVASLPLLLASVASVLLRWRRSHGVAREQFKCLAAAAATWPVVIVPLILLPSRISNSAFGEGLFGLAVVAIAAGIGVAVLRYRLYDIDRVISRTVSYTLVTGLLLAVYVGCVALMTRVLPLSSSFGVAVSTLAAAAMFQPLRRRVQHGVDRRFNRARFDAVRTADAFSARLRTATDLEAVADDLVAVVGRTIEPARMSLWVAS